MIVLTCRVIVQILIRANFDCFSIVIKVNAIQQVEKRKIVSFVLAAIKPPVIIPVFNIIILIICGTSIVFWIRFFEMT